MIRVNIVVEGQTEETFVKNVLSSYFYEKNIFLNPILVKTSKTGKGGGSSYGKIKNTIKILFHDKEAYVTTMWDYYGLPTDFPEKRNIHDKSLYEMVKRLEEAFLADINERKFIPNLVVHEFEGLLFSDLNAFRGRFAFENKEIENKKIECLKNERNKFSSPEHINDRPETAPSKRILKSFPSYQKVYHGSVISEIIGIDVIRNRCSHFHEWLQKLERLK